MQPSISHPQKQQRKISSESDQLPNYNDVMHRLSRDYDSNMRRYSASDESEGSTMYQMSNDLARHELSDTSPRQLSQDMDEERDVDMPYVIGQFKLENKLYRKPFFLSRASTFSEKSRENLPKKSNLKRAVTLSPKCSLKSHSSHSVINFMRK